MQLAQMKCSARPRACSGLPMALPAGAAPSRAAVRARAAAADAPQAAGADAAAAGDAAEGDTAPAAAGGVAPGAPGPQQKKGVNWVVSDGLLSIPIAIVGDDAALNWAVAQALAKRIGWFPVSPAKVLCGMHKAGSLQELIERDGADTVATYEADLIRGMRDQRRTCVATLGAGASTRPEVYDSLNASLIIWIDEQDRRAPKPDTPARALWRARAEVSVPVKVPTGFAAASGAARRGADEKAKEVVGAVVKEIASLLKRDPAFPGRKLLYAEFGYRGDWPHLMPENWNPAMDRLGAMPAPAAEAAEGEQQQQQQPTAAA